ncbi:MAG TPA: 6,7-dimethyl-8-ribityllumazine synthase [Candidatus Aphodousia faecipullorum]|nr:6,7-dimethyl-8-ribityllumazine synthase [Candidatus Aphodousia faecipullorum]
MSMDIIENSLDGRALRIGIVQSRFNEYAGEGLLAACLEELKRLGVVEEDVTLMRVPGALEIPYALQQLASTEEYDALIAIGAVIRGETYHFEIVSNESASGIMQVSLDFDIPIANAVLTTENDEQTKARLVQKGTDAARVAVEMANLRKEFMFEMEDE